MSDEHAPENINVDARGLPCPQPVIAAKKALDGVTRGTVTVLVDNDISRENVLKFAASQGCGAVWSHQGGAYSIRITKDQPGAAVAAVPGASTTTAAPTVERPVYLCGKDTLGTGSEELGAILMKSFFHTLVDGDMTPAAVLFVNSGVKLVLADSPVLEELQALAARGAAILACGTCLNYFHCQDQVAVGVVTNMYDIAAHLQHGQVVSL